MLQNQVQVIVDAANVQDESASVVVAVVVVHDVEDDAVIASDAHAVVGVSGAFDAAASTDRDTSAAQTEISGSVLDPP